MALFMVVVGILLAYSPAAFASQQPTCINITISNVFGIGDCLGGNADFCTSTSMPVTTFIQKLVGCTLKGIATEGTPEEVANALDGIVLILLNSVGLGDVVKDVVPTGMWCKTCKRMCMDPIVISTGKTGLLGKCVNDGAVFCQKGTLAEDTTYTELSETLTCFLNALSKKDLITITTGQICAILKLLKKANIGVDILTLLIKAGFTALIGVAC